MNAGYTTTWQTTLRNGCDDHRCCARGTRGIALLACALSLWTGGPVAAEPNAAAIKTVEPDGTSGRVVSLSLSDGLVFHAAGSDRRVESADLVRIRFGESDQERGRRDASVQLRNDDLLFGRIKSTSEGVVSLETAALGDVVFSLESVARINMPAAYETSFGDSVQWFDKLGPGREDRVLLTNGDVMRGFLSSVEEDAVTIDGPLGEVSVASRLVVAIRLAEAPAVDESRPRCILRFRDGSKLTVCSLSLTEDSVTAQSCLGPSVRMPAAQLASIEFSGGRWEWLADQSPISAEHTPMLSLPWDARSNRNVLGQELTVAGEAFEYGLGVHSRSSLIYDLGGRYSGFETLFGVDDAGGPLSDVDVIIRVDGQPRFRKSGVRHGTLHGPIRLDLRGANRIELFVDFGANGDVQDRFDWIEPALIR